MAFQAGKSSNFQITDAGAVSRDISAYLDKVTFPEEVQALDTSAFTATARTFIPGLKNATITLTGKWDPTATSGPDVVLQGLIGSNPTAFIYGPQGTTTGQVKYTGNAMVTRYSVDDPVDGLVTFTCELQASGAITRGVF